MRAAILAAGLLVIAAAAAVRRQGGGESWIDLAAADELLTEAGDTITSAAGTVADFFDYATGGFMKISAMRNASPAMLAEPNVRAFLAVIRAGEGTADEGGYSRLFAGGTFDGFADHPRRSVTASGITSTAAGAYQFLVSTWDETRQVMRLPDFSPASQDLGALGRIAARGALDDVRAGRFDTAVRKCAREWASLPGSPYGQPTISAQRARSIYAAAGGINNETVIA